MTAGSGPIKSPPTSAPTCPPTSLPASREVPGLADDGVLLRWLCRPGPLDASVVDAVLDGARLGAVWNRAVRCRVAGVVAHQLLTDDAAAGALAGAEHATLRGELHGVLRVGHARAVGCRLHGVEVLAALDAAGVCAAAVYGLGAESRLYPGNGARTFDGVDVLVMPAMLATARDVLASLGYTSVGATCWRRVSEQPTAGDPVINFVSREYLDDVTVVALLGRRVAHLLPDVRRNLVVLDPADALLLALAQIGAGRGVGEWPADWRAHVDVLWWWARDLVPAGPLPRALMAPVREGAGAVHMWWGAIWSEARR